jgi:hypothetical protein
MVIMPSILSYIPSIIATTIQHISDRQTELLKCSSFSDFFLWCAYAYKPFDEMALVGRKKVSPHCADEKRKTGPMITEVSHLNLTDVSHLNLANQDF